MPYLGDMPVLGCLFRRDDDRRDEDEPARLPHAAHPGVRRADGENSLRERARMPQEAAPEPARCAGTTRRAADAAAAPRRRRCARHPGGPARPRRGAPARGPDRREALAGSARRRRRVHARARGACRPAFAAAPAALPDRALLAPLPMQFARRHLVLPLARDADGLAVAVADPSALAAARRPALPLPSGRSGRSSCRRRRSATRSPAPTTPPRAPPPTRSDATARRAARARRRGSRLRRAARPARGGRRGARHPPRERAPHRGGEGAAPATSTSSRTSATLGRPLPHRRRPARRAAPPARLHATIVSRVKIMAGLDIAERRLPQDGRIRRAGRRARRRRARLDRADGFGERVVLRLLDRADARLDARRPRAGARRRRRPRRALLAPQRTASSSSPARPAAARRRRSTPRSSASNDGERNIITIEDPVEYQLRGISQMQVNPRIGLTFASGLRAVLRQDPDVILVGEIRDRETVEIAHPGGAHRAPRASRRCTRTTPPSAVTRLLDMGVEPYLIASSVRRRCWRSASCAALCDACARRRTARACRGYGFRGRTAIHELAPRRRSRARAASWRARTRAPSAPRGRRRHDRAARRRVREGARRRHDRGGGAAGDAEDEA